MARKSTILCFLLILVVLLMIILYNHFLSASFRKVLETKNFTAPSRINECTGQYKSNHFMYLDLGPGRTGSSTLRLMSLLAMSKAHCYTPVVNPNNRHLNFTEMYFDVDDIKKVTLNSTGFQVLEKQHVERSGTFFNGDYNWTVKCTCYGYRFTKDQIKYVQSTIRLKRDLVQIARTFVSQKIGNRPLVAVHVRRTDKARIYDVSWYEEYIKKAIVVFETIVNNIAFVFVSDDKEWCKKRFSGKNIYFSPFRSAGEDLALMSLCKYSVLTLGCYGYTAAWFGQHDIVIYNRKHSAMRYKQVEFFYPDWIGLD